MIKGCGGDLQVIKHPWHLRRTNNTQLTWEWEPGVARSSDFSTEAGNPGFYVKSPNFKTLAHFPPLPNCASKPFPPHQPACSPPRTWSLLSSHLCIVGLSLQCMSSLFSAWEFLKQFLKTQIKLYFLLTATLLFVRLGARHSLSAPTVPRTYFNQTSYYTVPELLVSLSFVCQPENSLRAGTFVVFDLRI